MDFTILTITHEVLTAFGLDSSCYKGDDRNGYVTTGDCSIEIIENNCDGNSNGGFPTTVNVDAFNFVNEIFILNDQSITIIEFETSVYTDITNIANYINELVINITNLETIINPLHFS